MIGIVFATGEIVPWGNDCQDWPWGWPKGCFTKTAADRRGRVIVANILKQPWARFVPDLVFWIVYIMSARYRIGAQLKSRLYCDSILLQRQFLILLMVGNIKSKKPVTFERPHGVSSQFPGKFKIVEMNAAFLGKSALRRLVYLSISL